MCTCHPILIPIDFLTEFYRNPFAEYTLAHDKEAVVQQNLQQQQNKFFFVFVKYAILIILSFVLYSSIYLGLI